MNIPNKLTITLTDSEKVNIAGWVQHYRANPQYVGVTSGNWNNGNPDYQSRIVLEAQTRARFEEIAAQFPEAAAPGEVMTDIVHYVGQWDDSKRHEMPVMATNCCALRVDVPDGIGPLAQWGYVSVYEYRGEPAMREMTISRTPGDFRAVGQGPLVVTGGTSASVIINVRPDAEGMDADGERVWLQAGQTYYINARTSARYGGRNCPAAMEFMRPRSAPT